MQSKGEFIYYVARGILIEKTGGLLDVFVPSMKFVKGQIVCLQNLIPSSGINQQVSNVFCSNAVIGSVHKLDVSYLKNILSSDPTKLLKLWEQLTWRLIIINHEKLEMFKGLV